ncbi:MAG: IS110 family transposase [Candidatus Hydromicrobium sp.]
MKAKKKAKLDLIGDDTLVVGVDVGKRNHYCRFINVRGYEIGKGFSFSNNRDGMEKIISKIEEAKKQNNLAKAVIGLEPSGHYWKPAAHYLSRSGYGLALVNPYHIKRIKEIEDNCQTKTDPKDSLLIAKLVRDGDFFDPNLAGGIYAELRRMYRLRLKVNKSLVREKTKLKILLDEYFPEYEDLFCDVLGITSEYIIDNYFLPEVIAKKNILSLAGKIKIISRGKIGAPKVLKLVEYARDSIGITTGLDAAVLEKTYILEETRNLKLKLACLNKKLKYYLDRIEHSKYLLSIPGVGVVTAAGFLGEVGDISKYKSAKEIIKLAGLNLVEISSGIKKGKKKISKRGNNRLRCLLYQCAVVAISKNSQIKKYFSYQAETKNKMKMVVAVQCKLARIMFALLKYKKYYDPEEVLKSMVAQEVA